MVRTSLAIALIAIAIALAWPFAAELSAVDRCLDAGCSFDYALGRCDFNVNHPSAGVWQRHGILLVGAFALSAIGCTLLFRRKT